MRRSLVPYGLVLVCAIFCIAGCGSEALSPTAPPTSAPVLSRAATAIPVPSETPSCTATPTLSPTHTAVPAVTATAEAFQTLVEATSAAASARVQAAESDMRSAIRCAEVVGADHLTSPVPLPADVGEAYDGAGLILRVPAGTVVRAPIGGTLSGGGFSLYFTKALHRVNIVSGDLRVSLAFPPGGYDLLVPEADISMGKLSVSRGQPLAIVDGSTVTGYWPGVTRGLEDFNVLLMAYRVQDGVWTNLPLGVGEDAWYSRVPRQCEDWPPAPTPERIARATATTEPTIAVKAFPTAQPYSGAIDTPMGRIVVFSEGDEIAVVELPQASWRQLGRSQWPLDSGSRPMWHPDGERLIYSSYDVSTGRRLVLLDASSGESQLLTDTVDVKWWGWSPDGQRLCWVGGMDIFVADSNGSSSRVIFEGSGDIWDCAWSPDSTRIAFVMSRPDAKPIAGVASREAHVVSVEDGKAARLTDFYGREPGNAPFLLYSVVWEPDGQGIVFAGAPQSSGVCRASLSGEVRPWVSDASGNPFAWLPDGRLLLARAGGLAVISTDDHQVFDLPMNLVGWPGRQALSPDAKFMVLISNTDFWNGEVYVVHIESGRTVTRLTADFNAQVGVAWCPAGE